MISALFTPGFRHHVLLGSGTQAAQGLRARMLPEASGGCTKLFIIRNLFLFPENQRGLILWLCVHIMSLAYL